jgi:XTP/dITP diphosphohydrolase
VQFEVADVLNGIAEKLIFRHPHIYGDATTGNTTKVADEEEVLKNWEKLKLKEGKKSVLEGVPRSLPPITKAHRIQDKVKYIGFDWDNKEQVLEKVMEELEELNQAVAANQQEEIELEFGDVLFALINYSRFIGVDAEQALEKTNQKFTKRFQWMERYTHENNLNMQEMRLEELDQIWNMAKESIKKEIL